MAVRFLEQVLCLASILTQQAFGNEFPMLLQEGAVPLEWKEANIIPLLKKSVKEHVNKLSDGEFQFSNF